MSGQSGLLSEALPPKQKEEPVGEAVSTACRLLPSGEKKDWKSELTWSFLLSSLWQSHLFCIWDLDCSLWIAVP